VTAVLNVSDNCPNHFESILEYKSIPVQDSYQADLLSKMDAAIDYISKYDWVSGRNDCCLDGGQSKSNELGGMGLRMECYICGQWNG